MMTQRFCLLLTTVNGLLFAAGCSSSTTPCTTCPDVSGNYDLRFDHGPPNAQGCSGFTAVTEGVLSVGQQGAALTGSFGGTALTGTLQDTYDLTLASQTSVGTQERLTLFGRFAAASTDGGIGHILGTVQQVKGASADGGSGTCSASAAFTATHQ